MEQSWYHLGRTQTLEKLNTSHRGLSEDEARQRRARYGQNELPRPSPTPLIALIGRQFKGSLVAILLVASGISFTLRDVTDAYVILAAVFVNVMVGFFQESRADRALVKLREVVTFQALVRRDGEEVLREVAELVPGDVVTLKVGSRIPADGRVLESNALEVNEAPLTGESFPEEKQEERISESRDVADRTNMVFMGTTVVSGEGLAVITATGVKTEFGRIAESLRGTHEAATPLQLHLQVLARFLGNLILLVAFSLFVAGLLLGKAVNEIFALSIAVAVAAIPEGLLVAVTVILAISTQRILRKHGLLRHLAAAETLGETTVICTDKTGTLTEGDMSVVRVITDRHDLGFLRGPESILERVPGESSSLLAIKMGLLCNDAHIEGEDGPQDQRLITGNPTERALIRAAHAIGFTKKELAKQFPRIASLPFAPERRLMATLHEQERGKAIVFLKGAPEAVLASSGDYDRDGRALRLSEEKRTALTKLYEDLSREGLRVLAFAYRSVTKKIHDTQSLAENLQDFVFVGFLALMDPLREHAKEMVAVTQAAGIKTVMITGDHPLTARSIAKELGLPANPENILTGEHLARLSAYDFESRIESISVYARVDPREKTKIVDAWQARNHVVAMTGDGVNDAPALKSADIGVALGSGTDVAKESADLVLLDNNFKTIIAAVEEGRVIYENIRKVVLYLLADSFSQVVIIGLGLLTGSFLAGFPLPLIASQVLWTNLITDGLPSIALTVEPGEREIMRGQPRRVDEPMVTSDMRALIVVLSGLSGLIGFGLFVIFLAWSANLALARTVAFVFFGISSLTYVFSIRSLRHSIVSRRPWSNPWLVVSVLVAGLIQLAAVYWKPLQQLLATVPLGLAEWLAVLVGSLMILLAVEAAKKFLLTQQS